MGGSGKRLLVLFLAMGALACGIKKPPSTDSLHPDVNDDGGAGEGGRVSGFGGTGSGDAGGSSSQSGSGGAGSGGIAGAPSTGGAVGSGGSASNSGGAIGTGGAMVNSGGAVGTGGVVTSSGGALGTGGGFANSGGAPGTGGAVVSSGGVSGTGGTVAGSGGGSATGGTTPPAGDGTCETPIVIATDSSQTSITIDTTARPHILDVPCATTGNTVVLSFVLTQRELVYADTFGTSWNTVLSFGDDCDGASGVMAAPGTAACNNDACGTSQSQAIALMGYGRHYLFVTGAPNQSGPVTVHFQHALAGSGPMAVLPAGIGTAQGTTSGTGGVSLCEASAPENSYWWSTCSTYQGGVLAASTCTGTAFDTVLSLQIPKAGTVNCADDDPACGIGSKMSVVIPKGAGIHVLTVDGGTGSAKGAYTLTYQRP